MSHIFHMSARALLFLSDEMSAVHAASAAGSPAEERVRGGGFVPACLSFDVDTVIERWVEVAGNGRRRAGAARGRPARDPRGSEADRGALPEPKIDLILYTSPASEKSQRALRTVREVLQDYAPDQVRFSTCDLSIRPQEAEGRQVVFTPTLVTQGQGPRTSIIGNLEDKDVLRDLLDANGVQRRWDR